MARLRTARFGLFGKWGARNTDVQDKDLAGDVYYREGGAYYEENVADLETLKKNVSPTSGR